MQCIWKIDGFKFEVWELGKEGMINQIEYEKNMTMLTSNWYEVLYKIKGSRNLKRTYNCEYLLPSVRRCICTKEVMGWKQRNIFIRWQISFEWKSIGKIKEISRGKNRITVKLQTNKSRLKFYGDWWKALIFRSSFFFYIYFFHRVVLHLFIQQNT